MNKKLLIITLFPIICFSQEIQESDLFFKNNKGLLFISDFFYESLNSGDIDEKDYYHLYHKVIEDHEEYLKNNTVYNSEVGKSYSELIEFYYLVENNKKVIDLSLKYYDVLKANSQVASNQSGIQLISRLVNYFNEYGNYEQSLLLLNDNDWITKRTNKFNCFTAAEIYYFTVGTMYFNTYYGLNEQDEALIYGFNIC